MPRPEEVEVVKAMKAAKTAEEILESWTTQRPGYGKPPDDPTLDFYKDHKPEMLSTFAHNQLTQLLDRGVLDPKTRYLILIACYMMVNHWDGVLPQACNAKAAGATDEEIMEVAFCACYAVGKAKMQESGACLKRVFDSPTFQNIQPLKK